MTLAALGWAAGAALLQWQAALPALAWALVLPLLAIVAIARPKTAFVCAFAAGFLWAALLAHQRMAGWLAPAGHGQTGLAGNLPPYTGRGRPPTPTELLAELKATTWTCATLNAGACASFPPSCRTRRPCAKSIRRTLPFCSWR